MANQIRKLGVFVALTAVLLLGVILLAGSYTVVGITSEVGIGTFDLSACDVSDVPQSVVDDAANSAVKLFGDYQGKYDNFVQQLLAAYIEAKDKDCVVVFNSGGWGWNLLEDSPGWYSIISGIESELQGLGYSSLVMDYRRTEETFRGVIDEVVEMLTLYPSKAENLAHRIEFLTEHFPEVRIIVAGESDGTIISNSAMNILQHNPQVYSIQTGPPFWHTPLKLERTLVLDNNGVYPDSFSRGDITAILWASLKSVFGVPPTPEEKGQILDYVKAPGHDYSWHHPAVYSRIKTFLQNNFEAKQQSIHLTGGLACMIE